MYYRVSEDMQRLQRSMSRSYIVTNLRVQQELGYLIKQ